jgi:hypothetical protein
VPPRIGCSPFTAARDLCRVTQSVTTPVPQTGQGVTSREIALHRLSWCVTWFVTHQAKGPLCDDAGLVTDWVTQVDG